MPPHEDVAVSSDHNMATTETTKTESTFNDVNECERGEEEGQQQEPQVEKEESKSNDENEESPAADNVEFVTDDTNTGVANGENSTTTTAVTKEEKAVEEYHPETNENRPSIITVTLFKETKESRLGIGLLEIQEVQEENDEIKGDSIENNDEEQETTNTDASSSQPPPKTITRVKIIALTHDGLLSQTTPLQVGDIIERVNNVKCTNYGPTLQRLRDAVGSLTIQISNADGHPNVVQSTFDPRSTFHSPGLLFETQSFITNQMPEDEPDKETHVDNDDKENDEHNHHEDTKDSIKEDDNNELVSDSHEANKDNNRDTNIIDDNNDIANRVLCIKRVPGRPFFTSKYGLQAGDRVLSINSIPSTQLLPEEAQELIQELVAKQTVVDLVVMRLHPPSPTSNPGNRVQQLFKSARKAGVAVGGGALVGVGLVFIPTLPPPFGEVLIAGGVSLLGTEFDAPKRVVRGARNSLARAVGPEEAEKAEAEVAGNGKNEEQVNDDQVTEREGVTEDSEKYSSKSTSNAEQDENGDPVIIRNDSAAAIGEGEDEINTETPANSNVPMKARFKNFGRRVVIPFLDQIVGDKENEEGTQEGKEEGKCNNQTNDATTENNDEDDTNNNEMKDEVVPNNTNDSSDMHEIESTDINDNEKSNDECEETNIEVKN